MRDTRSVLTATDAARIAGVSSRTIRRWVLGGTLRNVGTVDAVRVDALELADLIDPYSALARRVAGQT